MTERLSNLMPSLIRPVTRPEPFAYHSPHKTGMPKRTKGVSSEFLPPEREKGFVKEEKLMFVEGCLRLGFKMKF